jgi:hypothetical protein
MQRKKPGPAISPALLTGWRAPVVLAVLTLLFFRDIILRTSFFWEDFLHQYYAFRSFAATSLASGHLPLWNPYTFSGMPFQADIQSAIFYLPNMALTLFAGGGHLDAWWLELSMIAHYALAGTGMYLLAKDLRLEPVYALFAGIVYSFSGFMVGHLIHQGFIYQAAWFPLIFLFFRRGLLERALRPAIVAGLLLGHAILAGAPQITLYIVFFLFAYYCFELTRLPSAGRAKELLRMSLCAAGPIAVALLLTAVQLLPTMELAPLSQRADITYEKAAEGSLGYGQLITFAVPKYFGASGAQGSTFLHPGLAYWQYWETTAYFGIGALAFACIGLFALRKDRFVLFLGAMAAFGVLYALGNNFFLHSLFHEYVPGFDNFRVPGRMVLYADFAGAILAAFGLRHLTELVSTRSPAARKVALGMGVAALVLFLAGQAGFLVPPIPGGGGAAALATAATESAKGAAILGVVAVVLFLAGRGTLAPVPFVAAVLILQFVDAHVYGFDQNNGTVSPDAYYARTAPTAAFIQKEGEKEYFRVNSREGGAMILDRNEGMINRIFLMEGYTPLGLARFIPPMSSWPRTCDIMNAKYRIVVDQEKRSMSLAEATGYAPRAFMVYDSYLAASPEDARNHISSPTFDPMREAVFEEAPPALPGDPGRPAARPDAPDGNPADRGGLTRPVWEASIESYDLNEIRLRVNTPFAGYLILSEIWYPGWNASVDGANAPVLRADWCLRAVPVPGGAHEVVLDFSPASFRTGAWISGATLLAAVAGLFVARPKKDTA